MATKATKILIKKIITDPKYYPRQKVDQKRILEFVDAMECDEHFPPIKVVYVKKTGMYVLLDGKHRLEARILRGEIDIMADIFSFPEEHWLMVSARFNGKSSKPLNGEEIKQIITETWLSGIKDTTVIAREMNVSVRYVEKMLKPVRDEERDKRKEEILELHQQGMSQRQIAYKMGLSFCCINSTIKSLDGNNEEDCKSKNASISDIQNESPEKDEVIYKRTEFVFRSPNDDNKSNCLDITPDKFSVDPEAVSLQNSVKNETEKDKLIQNPNKDLSGATDSSPEAGEVFPKRTQFVLETSNEDNYINELNDIETVQDPAFNELYPKTPMETKSHEEASDESVLNLSEDVSEAPDESPEAGSGITAIHALIDSPEKSSPNCGGGTPISPTQSSPLPADNKPPASVCPAKKSTPYSYLDQIDAYIELPVQNQRALRAMELAKLYKMDIIDIAKEIDEPIIWVRKVLIAAIALSVMHGDHLDDASSVETMTGIGFDLARCIQGALAFQTMLCPVSQDMERWIKDNLSAKELDLILKLLSASKQDLPHLLKGETPPKKKNCIKIPSDAFTDQLQVHDVLLEDIFDHAQNKRFTADSAKKITARLNKHTILRNRILDCFQEGRFL